MILKLLIVGVIVAGIYALFSSGVQTQFPESALLFETIEYEASELQKNLTILATETTHSLINIGQERYISAETRITNIMNATP